MRKLVYFIASSIDGFIADRSGDFSFFPMSPATISAIFERYPETCPVHLRDPLGVTPGNRRFDTVIMGRKTFEPALQAGLAQGAYPHLRQIVVSRQELSLAPSIEMLSVGVKEQVAALKQQAGQDIWLCGGGELAGHLFELIDEVQIKLNPVLLGDGIPIFGPSRPRRLMNCTGIEELPGGVALLTYFNEDST